MIQSHTIKTPNRSSGRNKNRCLSCGTSVNMGKRRYCSIECRQYLRHQLNVRTGLLKALNTRYATFYFNDSLIFMDVLPFDAIEIFSFIFPRSQNGKPVEDFKRMADHLGNAWWAEVRRTRRRYLASRHLLEQASRNHARLESIKPFEIKKPAHIGNSIIHLKLDRAQLEDPQLLHIIKQAYRRQAKKYHPDQGGDAAAFRRIHEAYQQLLVWAESPTFVKRRGFPDKWFYDGIRNRWIQPTPYPGI
ncbi:MAG: DnaJ domain-containing protein [Deltaproteobacteria bacterium]|nr:DnaJ domain-containing protein [Deltaproteobacteria bacterium]MBW1963218.1 DnaJ domain-containing protein [Deltaproteobacteria bacterium]MBW1993351.1 DnaJ domain-containing protein [Deltaproteobacteria bacterium]MBW2150247.1 DnaJ domain-containing protein [Deltaproteobacteria bacterium]